MKKILLVIVLAGIAALLAWAFVEGRNEIAKERESEKPVAAPARVSQGVVTLDRETQTRIALTAETLTVTNLSRQLAAPGQVFEVTPLANLERMFNSWGGSVSNRTALVERLATFESVLVRVDLLVGDTVPTPPATARLVPLADEQSFVPAQYLGPALSVNVQSQAQSLVFLIHTNRLNLRPGAAVTAHLDWPGGPRSGVVVPRGAIVRVAGRAWVFVQLDETEFARREVALDQPTGDGWFITTGLGPSDRVVVAGAQILLSEEMKSQIQAVAGGD
jgi:hypothetical protein